MTDNTPHETERRASGPADAQTSQFVSPNVLPIATPTKDSQRQLKLAEAFIRENLYNPITIADIAAVAGLTVRSLQRLFRKYHGDTPVKILMSFRVAAARELILEGKAASVRDVAARFHFTNPGRFSKLYRTMFSRVPSEEIRAQTGKGDGGQR